MDIIHILFLDYCVHIRIRHFVSKRIQNVSDRLTDYGILGIIIFYMELEVMTSEYDK